ncbi:MAG TPA: glycolate oxidase subunit GlcF [Acetobacteraceae bacterium]|nr:glycolate oxidase subunit GlcF [Acetobacteraceae bacterium]
MQTRFTATQLADPDIAASNEVLRRCVHCGFCTATCPTFVLLGDELDSPRGRIYLMQEMLEKGGPASPDVVRHVDRCLSCLACMTTCPSGVHYMHLVDHARAYIERNHRRPAAERAVRALLAMIVPRPRLFRQYLRVAQLARPFRALLPARSILGARLRAMLELVPSRLPSPSPTDAPRTHGAQGTRRARVALLAGCAQQVLDPEINAATIRLLTRLGVEVVVAKGAGCCGALVHHMGKHDEALKAARANIRAWQAEIAGGELDAIIVTASGCGTMLKDYGFLLRTSPEREAAEKIAGLAMDISEFLHRFGYEPSRPASGIRLAYHAACSLQHGQRITTEPKSLLTRAGFTLVEPREAHLCCGSAGTYNLLQPEIAQRLRARKLANLEETGAAVIAAGNIGCITQLAAGRLPIVHPVQLLDWMAGGPKPAALAEVQAG